MAIFKLRDIRLQRGLSQKDIAEMLGVKPSIVSRYETGSLTPSLKRVKQMAEILDVPVNMLLNSSETSMVEVTVASTRATEIITALALDLANKIDALDELGVSVVSDVIETQYRRCVKKHLYMNENRSYDIPKTLFSERDLYAKANDDCNLIYSKLDKSAHLQKLKENSYLTDDVILTLLALRGYNDLMSIKDIKDVFRGNVEPSEMLYEDLVLILQRHQVE